MAFTGKYEFTIGIGLGEHPHYQVVFTAEGTCPGEGHTIITQGRTKEEVFDMIADAYLTSHGVKLSWWNNLLKRLMVY